MIQQLYNYMALKPLSSGKSILFCPLVLRPTLSPCRQVAAETSQAEDHRHGLDGVDRQWKKGGLKLTEVKKSHQIFS